MGNAVFFRNTLLTEYHAVAAVSAFLSSIYLMPTALFWWAKNITTVAAA